MFVIQIFILSIILVFVPMVIGRLFYKADKRSGNPLFMWISGQILLWAGFQGICVPMILLEKSFSQVQYLFLIYTGILLSAALITWGIHLKKRNHIRSVSDKQQKKYNYILWGIFIVLLLSQLLLAGFMMYEEGDDAFYVAISTSTLDSNTMYNKLPYTGGTTGLDARHGLAPFPVWISYLAKLSGMPAVTVAQIALPFVLIVMTYAVYYLIGKRLLEKKEQWLPVFMIIVEIMVLFGGYSIYSAENFLLVRTAQGKAVIANIIIPFLFLLMFLLLEKLQKEEKFKIQYWVLLDVTMIAGCLCSTLGTLLTCIFTGIVGMCAAFCYRRLKILIPMILSCVVPAGFAVLYFLLD